MLSPGDRVAVAVSGGADSVALLEALHRLASELGLTLDVVHVNHHLRGEESNEDAAFVQRLAAERGLQIQIADAPLDPASPNLEEAARDARLAVFHALKMKVATAHTLDDQAETVLLRMLRGTGIRGLAGIHPRITFEEQGDVVRPLLGFRRSELEKYLRDHGQAWREDSTNADPTFLRNRVRHRVLPLLKEEFGAAAVENLAGLAEISRAEEERWQSGHPEVRPDASDPHELGKLAASLIVSLPLAAQRRLLMGWLEANVSEPAFSFRTIEEVRELALGTAGRKIHLPGGHWVRRTQRELLFEPGGESTACDYEYRLPVPGAIDVPELGGRVEALLIDPDAVPPPDRASLLGPSRLPGELMFRNWRPGDRYWPEHTKEERKVKELLADRHLTGAQKKLWPVAVASGLGLVWMRDFPAPAALRPSSAKKDAIWIRLLD